MMRNFWILFIMLPVLVLAQASDWQLKLSSNVEIRNWKLTSKADKEEKALGGATIVLTKNGQTVAQTTSSGNGDFTIMVPPNGDYLLTVSYPGYNTKRFSVNTFNVPEDFAKNDYKPTFSIGGFIMAKAFPGIDYSGLGKPLVKVEFKPKKKVFDHDEIVTNQGLSIVTKIYKDEDALIQNFCNTNKQGDIALAKPDCPLAKSLYEKAIKIIPGESYPVEQLAKVGECLKNMEDAEKAAAEKAKLAQEEAAAKAKAEKEAKDNMAAEAAEAKAKAAAEATAAKNKAEQEAKEKEELKKKEALEKEQKKKDGMSKAKAEDEAEAKAIAEKKETERLAKEKEKQEKLKKQQEGLAKAKAEDEAEAKALAEEKERKRKAKEEEENQKRLQYETETGVTEGDSKKGNSKHGIYQTLGVDKYKENIKKADEYFKMKRYSEAKPFYEEALKVKPEDPYAKTKLEEIEKQIKKD